MHRKSAHFPKRTHVADVGVVPLLLRVTLSSADRVQQAVYVTCAWQSSTPGRDVRSRIWTRVVFPLWISSTCDRLLLRWRTRKRPVKEASFHEVAQRLKDPFWQYEYETQRNAAANLTPREFHSPHNLSSSERPFDRRWTVAALLRGATRVLASCLEWVLAHSHVSTKLDVWFLNPNEMANKATHSPHPNWDCGGIVFHDAFGAVWLNVPSVYPC